MVYRSVKRNLEDGNDYTISIDTSTVISRIITEAWPGEDSM